MRQIKIAIGGIAGSEELVRGFGLVHLAAKNFPGCVSFELYDKPKRHYWKWLDELNRSNGWKHTTDFIAWYEYDSGVSKCLIGGLQDFAEYMSEEYGVHVHLTPFKLKELANNIIEVQQARSAEEEKLHAIKLRRRVSIVHCGLPPEAIVYLATEVFDIKSLESQDGIEITFFQSSQRSSQSIIPVESIRSKLGGNGTKDVRVAKNLKQAVKDCQLLIFAGSWAKGRRFSRLLDELRFLAKTWTDMGVSVNELSHNQEMKVILACTDYPCFNATFFAHSAPHISTDSVIAVTHHLALPALDYISKESGIPMSHIMQRTAYVWGSPGISHYVDLENTDFIFSRPTMPLEEVQRLKSIAEEINWQKRKNPFSNLEFQIDYNWRKMDYVVRRLENVWLHVGLEKERNASRPAEAFIPLIRATREIIDHWYSPVLPTVPISAGVYSTGIYGVPKGLIYSVPALVRDDERRGWFPFKWCQDCRQDKALDSRLRWNITPCDIPGCLNNLHSKSKCCHQRNPDVFLPQDELLSLDEMITTAVSLFYALDSTGNILSKIIEPGEMESFEIVDGSTKDNSRRYPSKIDESASRIRQAKFSLAEKLQIELFGDELAIKIIKKPKETLVEKIKRSELKKSSASQRRESVLSRTPRSDSVDSRTNSVRSKLAVNSNQEEEEEPGHVMEMSPERELEGEMEEIGTENEVPFMEIDVYKTSETEMEREEDESPFVEKTAGAQEEVEFSPIMLPLEDEMEEALNPLEEKSDIRLYTAEVLSGEHLPNGFNLSNFQNERQDEHLTMTASLRAESVKSMAGVAAYLHRFGSVGDLPLADAEHCNHPPERREHLSRTFNRRRFSFFSASGMIPPAKLDIGRFVSPEREEYEDDMTYERRWAEARDKYDKMLHQDEKKPLAATSSDNILSIQSNVIEENTNEEHLMDEQEQEIHLEIV